MTKWGTRPGLHWVHGIAVTIFYAIKIFVNFSVPKSKRIFLRKQRVNDNKRIGSTLFKPIKQHRCSVCYKSGLHLYVPSQDTVVSKEFCSRYLQKSDRLVDF